MLKGFLARLIKRFPPLVGPDMDDEETVNGELLREEIEKKLQKIADALEADRKDKRAKKNAAPPAYDVLPDTDY